MRDDQGGGKGNDSELSEDGDDDDDDDDDDGDGSSDRSSDPGGGDGHRHGMRSYRGDVDNGERSGGSDDTVISDFERRRQENIAKNAIALAGL